MFMRLVCVLVLMRTADGAAGLLCEYEELKGKWIFDVGVGGFNGTINCSVTGEITRSYKLLLDYPDVVRDDMGNVGFWTMVDSVFLEVVVHGRKFFAYIPTDSENGSKTRLCNRTFRGSSHNVLGKDWACFFGHKASTTSPPPATAAPPPVPLTLDELLHERNIRSANDDLTRKNLKRRLYRTDVDLVEAINAAQSSWTATNYDEYNTMTVEELLSMAGYRLHPKNSVVNPAPITEAQQKRAAGLPDSIDWRYVKGINYISPVRHQGGCGSCYAFTSAAMNEARLAIFNNSRSVRVIFSPQDVVDCSFYSLGCNGGNTYTIAGKYSEDYGMVEESCNPYRGAEGKSCSTKPSCKRHYFTGYEYIGGFYGACNEVEMMLALVNYGPLALSMKVKEDLMFYKSGIYSSTGITSKFNPFVEVDHAVTLIGYGVDKIQGKYWIIKNSWGTEWGDNGFFRLRRGINECGVESAAVQSFPIF